jgi:hypothetical protein
LNYKSRTSIEIDTRSLCSADAAKDILMRWADACDRMEATANGYLASMPDPYTRVERLWLQTALDRLLSVLTAREQAVLRLRFGLATPGPSTLSAHSSAAHQRAAIPFTVELRPLVEVGKQLGISKSKTQKFETKALQKLRSPQCVAALRVRFILSHACYYSRLLFVRVFFSSRLFPTPPELMRVGVHLSRRRATCRACARS